MTTYRYQARDPGGDAASGVIEAESRQAALGLLAARGLLPTRLEEAPGRGNGSGANGAERTTVAVRPAEGPSGPASSVSTRLPAPEKPEKQAPSAQAKSPAHAPAHAPGGAARGRISRKEVTVFTRRMATLLGATIPIPTALRSMGEEESNQGLKTLIQDLDTSVRKGNSFSASLQTYPRHFSRLYCSMIQVGEEAGALDKVMNDLADLLEHEDEIRGEVLSAVAYPCFVLVMGIATTVVLLAFVLPRLFGMLQGMLQVLPLPTQMLLAASAFFEAYWLWLCVGTAAAVAATRWYVRTPAGALLWDGVKLRLPLLGPVFRASALGRFSRTLGTLVRSGVSILPALEIVKSTVGNRVIENAIAKVSEETRGGDSLAAPLRKLGYFPPTVVQMVSVGEETGRLDEMLLRIAQITERQMRAYSRTLISLLAPALILVVGAVVGFIVIALLLPIFRMSQSIN